MQALMQMQPIKGIDDPSRIRVVIFVNGQMLHVALPELLKAQQSTLTDLEARVAALESASSGPLP
ncbi:hypothetical protein EFD56_03330 [Rhizobium phaseoli]|uniref:hypothetical protein n=1 Tax=Rhizobium phaseoli TaxID=396 RepID=UPI000F88F0A8|nr:hypothetical protein [Rhizobium phaseoli]RUM21528.1 hypothetical protein EFD56_03330 [Rhizobium phaseoli]